jgi:hypothetical protein
MKTPLLVLAVTTGGLAIAAGYLVHQVGVERDRVRAETLAKERLEARVKELEQVRAMLEMQIPEPAVEVSATKAPSGNNLLSALTRSSSGKAAPVNASPEAAERANASAQTRSFNFGRHREWMRSQLQNPQSRAALHGQHKAGTRMSFADLGEELGLAAEQEDKLFDLLADQQLRTMEATMDSSGDPTATQAAFKQVQSETDAELMAFLGPERYQQFKDYQETLPERMELREFRGLLDADNALRDEQARQLMQIMREERERAAQDMSQKSAFRDGAPDPAAIAKMAEQSLRLAEVSSRRMRERAAQVLTGEQLRRFNQIHEQRLNMQRMATRMTGEQAQMGGLMMEAQAVTSHID